MKFLLVALLASSTSAFTTSSRTSFGTRGKSFLQVTARPDASSLVAEALAASAKYGAASPEARLAWEAVEEVDASDNSASFAGNLDDECEAEAPTEACLEYGQKLEELSAILRDQGPKIEQIKSLAREIQAVKLKEAPVAPAADSPALQAALKAAKAVTEKHGISSAEARLAWEDVEEMAAASSQSNALGGMIGDECLVETIEACEALEELQRAIHVTSNDGSYKS